MSILNGTLFLQAIHFYIAFLLIKHLLFKPVVRALQEQDTLQESLLTTIAEHQRIVAQKEKDIAKHTHMLQAFFRMKAPNVEPRLHLAPASLEVVIPSYDHSTIEQAAHKIASQLVPRIERV